MKVVVCGGRDYPLYGELCTVLDHLHAERGFTLLAHGDAGRYLPRGNAALPIRGADVLAGRWADERGVQQVKVPANWNGRGNAAGMERNAFLLDLIQPDLVVGFPGGIGTSKMMYLAHKRGIEVIATEDLVL